MPVPESSYTNATTSSIGALNFITLEQIDALPKNAIPFIVDDLLPSSGLSLMVGKPKAGKSHLVRQLAASVVKGESFLGREVAQGEVLYFALEEKPEEVREHFKALGIDSGIHTHFGMVRPDALDLLPQLMETYPNTRLVIIDPIVRFLRPKDSNSYTDVSAAMEKLITFARQHEAHVLGVHHLSKKLYEDARDGTLGSTAFNGAADTIFTLGNKGGTRNIFTTQRYGKELPQTNLAWDANLRTMSVGISEDEQTRQNKEQNDNRIASEILEYLTHSPGALEKDVYATVEGKSIAKYKVLKSLLTDNIIARAGNGIRGDAFTYYVNEIPVEPQPQVYIEP